jgi:hypothetical protein
MTVGVGTRHFLAREHAAGAWLVLDDELLAEPFADLRRHGPGRDVRNAAGAEGHDHADRFAWECLRSRQRRRQRENEYENLHSKSSSTVKRRGIMRWL